MQRTLARRPGETAARSATAAPARVAARVPSADSWDVAPAGVSRAFGGHDFRRLSRREAAEETATVDHEATVAREETVSREPDLTTPAAPAPAIATDPGAVEMKTGANQGSTSLPATVNTTYDVGGNTLAEVAANLPADEAGNAGFAISVTGTTGDPITSANATVTHHVELPHWTEQDKQCAPVKRAWDSFLSALSRHEQGHIALSRTGLASVHTKFIGIGLSDIGTKTASETAATQTKYDDYDASNGHGLTGTPPTILDTGIVCPPPKTSAAETGPETPETEVAAKLDRKSDRESGGDVSHIVDQGLSGGGQPLDGASRSFFEPRLGQDLSGIRIHTGSAASQSAEQVSARAYAVGNNIAFRDGEYNPGTSAGRHLLAHELAHTVQQGATRPLQNVSRREDDNAAPEGNCNCGLQRKMSVSQPGDPSEVEADRVADSVMRIEAPGMNRHSGEDATAPSPLESEPVEVSEANSALQRVPFLPPGGFPTPNTPATPPVPPPADPNAKPDDGLVHVTIPYLPLSSGDMKSWPLYNEEQKFDLATVPIPDFGTAALSLKAGIGANVSAGYGAVVITDLTLSMTKLMAASLGAALLSPFTPGLLPLLLKLGYMEGYGKIEVDGFANAAIRASCALSGELRILGLEGAKAAEAVLSLYGALGVELGAKARGAVRVVLDNGHLTFSKAMDLNVAGAVTAALGGDLTVSVLFGLIKAHIGKQWTMKKPFTVLAAEWGDASLLYDFPSFKSVDKIFTLRVETIKKVASFIKDMITEDTKPGEVKSREKAPEFEGEDKRSEDDKIKAVESAKAEADAALSETEATPESVRAKFPAIKHTYRLTAIELHQDGEGLYWVHVAVNPERNTEPHRALKAAAEPPAGAPAEGTMVIRQTGVSGGAKTSSSGSQLPGKGGVGTRSEAFKIIEYRQRREKGVPVFVVYWTSLSLDASQSVVVEGAESEGMRADQLIGGAVQTNVSEAQVIEALTEFNFLQKGTLHLKPEYQGSEAIRASFYGNGYAVHGKTLHSTQHAQAVSFPGFDPANPNAGVAWLCPGPGGTRTSIGAGAHIMYLPYEDGSTTIDHILPAAQHWNATGRTSLQNVREAWDKGHQ